MTKARTREYCEIAERLVPHRFRTQGWRRRFVVLGNALALATIASVLLDLGSLAVLLGISASVCCAMFFGAVLVPEGVMGDEESRLRDRSHRQSYTFASYLLFPAGLLAAAVVADRDAAQIAWAFMAGCLLFWGVPYSIVAWGLPEDYANVSETADRAADVPEPAMAPASSSPPAVARRPAAAGRR
jgi:hypothetical protein